MIEGKRDPITSESVSAGHRTYFFDIYEAESGAKYLRITESKSVGESSFERRDIVVWLEHMPVFFQGLVKSITAQGNRKNSLKSEENIREPMKNGVTQRTKMSRGYSPREKLYRISPSGCKDSAAR